MQDNHDKEPLRSAAKIDNIDKVLEDLPKDKRDVIYSAFYAIERSYSGPLPPPEDFAKYDKTLLVRWTES